MWVLVEDTIFVGALFLRSILDHNLCLIITLATGMSGRPGLSRFELRTQK